MNGLGTRLAKPKQSTIIEPIIFNFLCIRTAERFLLKIWSILLLKPEAVGRLKAVYLKGLYNNEFHIQ